MSAVPVDPLKAAETRKGCLALYAVWAVFTALFVGFILVTGGKAGDAAFFGIVLIVLPGAIWLAKLRDERLIAEAAARLGFRVREVSWKDGERVEPRFEREAVRREWNYDLIEGWHDGADVTIYRYTSAARSSKGGSDRALGVIWTLAHAEFPRLVVHGQTNLTAMVTAPDGSSVLSLSPPIGIPSPVPGFLERFSSFGEAGAEALLTEAVQRALLDLPKASRLLVEGSRIRWESDGGPLARGLGRKAEKILQRTMPLRDALRDALRLVPRRP